MLRIETHEWSVRNSVTDETARNEILEMEQVQRTLHDIIKIGGFKRQFKNIKDVPEANEAAQESLEKKTNCHATRYPGCAESL